MGSINNYCPHCASTKIYEISMSCNGNEIELDGVTLFYECGDCHSTWERHKHEYFVYSGTDN